MLCCYVIMTYKVMIMAERVPDWLYLWLLQLYVRPEASRSWALEQSEGSLGTGGCIQHSPGNVPQLYIRYVGENKHRQLADFDEHLEDLSRDWTNRQLMV